MKIVILNKEITLLRMFLLVVVLPIIRILQGLFFSFDFLSSLFGSVKNISEKDVKTFFITIAVSFIIAFIIAFMIVAPVFYFGEW
ncbi:MAG: hypothetical protein N4A44_03725 [Alphaproteobacteria bacterium]|jgi:hypothetical protein|nr:hypothetical protein [Alphaproteobacteria bacterium]